MLVRTVTRYTIRYGMIVVAIIATITTMITMAMILLVLLSLKFIHSTFFFLHLTITHFLYSILFVLFLQELTVYLHPASPCIPAKRVPLPIVK